MTYKKIIISFVFVLACINKTHGADTADKDLVMQALQAMNHNDPQKINVAYFEKEEDARDFEGKFSIEKNTVYLPKPDSLYRGNVKFTAYHEAAHAADFNKNSEKNMFSSFLIYGGTCGFIAVLSRFCEQSFI